MATHANSTPAPERTLLREAAAPGRLLPASLPNKLSPHAEFLLLMDIKRQTEARLNDLVEIMDPKGMPHLPMADIRGATPAAILSGAKPMPRSGLVQASPGVLLFKTGGHDARG